MTVLSHFALPITLSTPILRRFHLSPPLTFSSSLQFTPRRIFLRPVNRRRSFARSMGTDENQEAVAPTSVPVRVAHELLQAGHRYLDVRMVHEFNAGHVVGATNIPFMFKVGSGMTKNQNFVNEVSKAFGKDDEILIVFLRALIFTHSSFEVLEQFVAFTESFCRVAKVGRGRSWLRLSFHSRVLQGLQMLQEVIQHGCRITFPHSSNSRT